MKVKCSVCGKITAGRLPRRTRHDIGDGTFWYPRRHKCVGDIQEGLLVETGLRLREKKECLERINIEKDNYWTGY